MVPLTSLANRVPPRRAPVRGLPATTAVALAFALVLGACGGADPAPASDVPPAADAPATPAPAPAPPSAAGPTPAPSPAPGTTPTTPTPTPGDPAPAPADPPVDGDDPPRAPGVDEPTLTTARSSADATHTLPAIPVLRAVRTGVQPGADRLVFEFDGDGLPAWSIEYVDRPQYECGSGEAVRLRGDAWLQIRFTGAAAHTEAGEGTSGPRRRTLDMANLLELARICDFEGEVTWIAAVARPDGYTPRTLSAPARLVVDIAH